ncbi:hypothetical protein JL722_11611 [Aureococcus anophagefferens]|nr:hypothetical protein JL722_11611 [Aureococcus anophagefferens]
MAFRTAARRTLSSSPKLHRLRSHQASHIDLEEIDRLLFRASRDQLWVPPGGRGVFGGQILGQALHAATRAVGGGWGVHSLHGYFLQAGNPRHDVIYRVKETSERRSFATRSVEALQGGDIIFKMQTSFSVRKRDATPQPSHQDDMPAGVPPPESLPSMRESIEELLPRLPEGKVREEVLRLAQIPVDLRFVDRPDPLDPDPPKQAPVWMRVDKIDRALKEADGIDACCAAYTSDHAFLTTALLPHGIQLPSPKLGAVASLDHSMWFHAPFRADDWLLYDIRSPRLANSRGLALGSLYQDGQLVVSVAQEGLLRLARGRRPSGPRPPGPCARTSSSRTPSSR